MKMGVGLADEEGRNLLNFLREIMLERNFIIFARERRSIPLKKERERERETEIKKRSAAFKNLRCLFRSSFRFPLSPFPSLISKLSFIIISFGDRFENLKSRKYFLFFFFPYKIIRFVINI